MMQAGEIQRFQAGADDGFFQACHVVCPRAEPSKQANAAEYSNPLLINVCEPVTGTQDCAVKPPFESCRLP
jgi:hypothetical protein